MAGREDIIVSPLVQLMLDKLASPMSREFGSTWGVEQELEDLSQTLRRILAILKFAEKSQMNDDLLKIRLAEFRDVGFYAHNVLDEFIYEALRDKVERSHTRKRKQQVPTSSFLTFTLDSTQVLRPHDIADIVIKINEKLVVIEMKIGDLESNSRRRKHESIGESDRRLHRKTSSIIDESHFFGRTDDVKVVKTILVSDRYDNHSGVGGGGGVPVVVSIVGMAGLGKTTLAQKVYNDLEVQKCFDVRAWVYVSQDFNVERLIEAILESASRTPSGLKELEPLHCALQDGIKKKRVLLVLDDVWNEDRSKWDVLRVPFRVAHKGSRIIVTTRSERVSSIMGSVKTHKLKPLSDDDCWTLFKNRAFLGESSDCHQNLEAVGRQIVERCKGLPLAANTLGGLLHSKLDENEWQAILESEMWDIEEDNNILPALILSYHHLPAHLKQCFAYCALFPKGYEFKKKKIVRMWMAEGFVRSKRVDRMEDIGRKYFDDLLHRSFFQYSMENESKIVKMHDLVHDLAQLVSHDICFRMERDESCDISKKARHISIITWDLDSINNGIYKCKGLSTFLLTQCGLRCGQFPHDLFEELRCLRVLDLGGTRMERLPDSVANLRYLRYLDLSRTDIRELPVSICKLYNLQTLILEKCLQLHQLPEDTKNLINLQHLIVEEYLCSTPPEIGRLTCLKRLRHFCVGQSVGSGIGELKELRHLGGAFCILKLENVVNILEAMEANLKNKTKLDELELRWSDGSGSDRDVEILEVLQPHTKLKCLNVKCYGGLRFPRWMMDLSGYNKLAFVALFNCKRCKFLPPLGQLPLLEYLHIEGMEEVKQVGLEFYGDDRKGFQSLKVLTFKEMPGLEEWFGAVEGAFPCLQKLKITACPRLRKLPPFLPTVKNAYIDSLWNLTAFPRLPSVSELYVSQCDERVWSWLCHCTCLSSLCITDLRDPTYLPPEMQQPLETFEMSLSEGGLQHFTHLKHLVIKDCPHLMYFPKMLPNLSSLEQLRIEFCDKLISFPEGEEETLPPKLKHLWIQGCSLLKSLPKGLQNLSSLEELVIENCDDLMSLPDEGLPISLRILTIDRCSQLNHRCQEGGETGRK